MAVINLSGFIKELNESKLSREEKIEKTFNYLLNSLNQGVEKDWEKTKNHSLMLMTLAEHEWKRAKEGVLQEIIKEKGESFLRHN